MNLKFWKKTQKETNETAIQVNNVIQLTDQAKDNTIYVKAQSPEKALELYDKLKERQCG